MLDGYTQDRFDRVILFYTRFHQHHEAGAGDGATAAACLANAGRAARAWDYIYEPDAQAVLDQVLVRYIEAMIYQAVAENMASEQSARMVAMKAASDNAGNVIDELTLIYNKTVKRRSPKRFPRSSAAQRRSDATNIQ